MDVQVTNRLLALGYKDDPAVTRNRLGDCLFLCFVQSCRDATSRKFTVHDDGKYMITYPTHATMNIADREELEISTVTGMRLLAADGAEAMLSEETPNAQAPLLKRHILHRFRSKYMLERDREAMGGELLPDDASDADKVDYWKRLMRCNGKLYTAMRYCVWPYILCFKAHSIYPFLLYTCSFLFYSGWGDTATVLVLSEQLDIDVFMYTPPDTRLSTQELPNKFRPLIYRKSTHKKAGPTRMVIRYHESHFIYQKRFQDSTARIGVAADHEHYLTGTHDVATGRCVHAYWQTVN
jgi:hypothetical protein